MNVEWITKQSIVEELKNLNLNDEEILLVYGDVSENSHIIGGVQTVMEAIFEAVGYHTTVMMPAHRLSSKPTFFDPNLPKNTWEYVPAFDVNLTPVASGNLAQVFAMHKSAIRSAHPLASFVAIGQKASWLMNNHQKTTMFGNGSPLEKAYAQGAKLLCIGNLSERLTALHLLNYLAGKNDMSVYEAPVSLSGTRATMTFKDLELDGSAYGKILSRFAENYEVGRIQMGDFNATLLDYRTLIDFGAKEISA